MNGEEHGWMIERLTEGSLTWWTGDGFSTNSNDGVRFARSQDGQKVIDANWPHPTDIRVTEHIWEAPRNRFAPFRHAHPGDAVGLWYADNKEPARAGGSEAQDSGKAPAGALEEPMVPLWMILSDEDWNLVTKTVCNIEIGGSFTAIRAVLEGLRDKLRGGWTLGPPNRGNVAIEACSALGPRFGPRSVHVQACRYSNEAAWDLVVWGAGEPAKALLLVTSGQVDRARDLLGERFAGVEEGVIDSPLAAKEPGNA